MRTTALLLLLGLAAQASAQKLGLGVMVGEPTGLNAKVWLNKSHALDFGLAWSMSDNQDLHLHMDYLFHNHAIFASGDVPGKLSLFYGIGGRLRVRDDGNDNHGHENDENWDKDRLGVRIPLGISWVLAEAPIDFFVEVAPVMDLVPDTDLDVEGGVGVRFWFR